MIVVNPEERITQHLDDAVVYQLPYSTWSADLERPDNKEARVSVVVIRGEPLIIKVLSHKNQMHEIRVSGGSKNGLYEIVRVVKAGVEVRRRKFILKVIK